MFQEEIRAQLESAEHGADAPVGDPGAPRIAVYDDSRTAPRVVDIPEARLPDLIDALATRTYDLARQQGSSAPYTVLREVIENLIHAYFTDVVVTIQDRGATIRISDRGPGIPDKERAVRPGFTTADTAAKRFIRGVGSGLPIVRESLHYLDGVLEIEDNLDRGTVVTIRLTDKEQEPREKEPTIAEEVSVSQRQLKALLLLIELGAIGPTYLAHEMGVSASTAYRDLSALERLGLVEAESHGRRTITSSGLAYVDAVL